MRGIGNCRRFPLVLVFLFCFGLPATSVSTDDTNLVWFADHNALQSIDAADNTIAQRIALGRAPDAIAVDVYEGGIWALAHRRLLNYDRTGAVRRDISLMPWDVGPGEPELLRANPYDGSLWVATERAAIHLSREGERLVYWRAPARIRTFALDLDESLWVLSQNTLFHISPAGALIESLDLRDQRITAQYLAVDGLGGAIWIGGKHRVVKFNLNRLADPPLILALPDGDEDGGLDENEGDDEGEEGDEDEKVADVDPQSERSSKGHVHGIDVHPVFGTLWVATRHQLVVFDRDGAC